MLSTHRVRPAAVARVRRVRESWCIEWPDGRVIQAPSARELLERIGRDTFEGTTHLPAVRSALARRAEAWSGAVLPDGLSHEQFVRALGRSGIFKLVVAPPRHASG